MHELCLDCDSPAVSEHLCSDCMEEVSETPAWDADVPRKYRHRRCAHCDGFFQSQSKTARFCSKSCVTRSRSVQPGPLKPCKQCGNEFAPSIKKALYCSAQCRNQAGHDRAKADGRYAALLVRRRAERVRTRYQLACEHCGSEFERRRPARFCSERCREAANPKRCSNHPDRPVRARGLCSTCYNDQRYGPDQRRAQRTQAKICETCGATYAAQRGDQRYCSLLCRSGGEFVGRWTEAQRRAGRENRRRRRAILRDVKVEQFTEREIYERDGWRCQICQRRVDQRLAWPHPMCASLDHIIPLTEPGTSHTRANVRLAHLRCNTARSNRGGNEQLALIG